MASKDKVFYSKSTLNLNGKIMDLSSPKIMGILNVTDDSFFDGGKYQQEKEITLQAEKLISEGANIIDIGGYSSRPGAAHIAEEIELKRVLKGIETIRSVSESIPISVDTFRSKIVQKSIEAGADMINDISGGSLDKNMFDTISRYNVPYVMMHMVGTPRNMLSKANYSNIIVEILDYFSKKEEELMQLGVKDVIIDVGFGFSKTTLQNYSLLKNLECFQVLNSPMLIGVSRKSMIYKILNTDQESALNGTSVLNSVAMLKGAAILRVHDVKEAKEVIDLINLI